MTQITDFDPDLLRLIIFDPKKHQLSKLNLAQSNGQDPLAIQKYYENIKQSNYSKNELIYLIKYGDGLIGFFAVMLAKVKPLHPELNSQNESVVESTINAFYIKKIGIDQEYRCFGIGKYVLQFCIGLAKSINEIDEIEIILFITTNSLAEKIYSAKYKFKSIPLNDRLVWIFKRI